MRQKQIKRSEKIAGTASNYDWPISFDLQRGHLGITQFDGPESGHVTDRVLLSPEQVKAMMAFLGIEKAAFKRGFQVANKRATGKATGSTP